MQTTQFYSAWFCPYAQRAWLTLEHHQIPYDYVESLSVKKDQSEGQHGYEKNPRLLELNPKGLVPTLALSLDFAKAVGLDHRALKKVEDFIVLSESIDCIEILDAIAAKGVQKTQNLIPDPFLTADAHRMNQNICSTFYKVLMKPTMDEQKEAFDFFSSSIEEFLENVQENGFYKSSCPTIVDFTVIPWFLRIPLLRHYRPMFELEENMSKTNSEKLNSYVERINGLSAVKKTLWKDEEAFIEVYKRYANGTATSQVGQAVRSGKNAHDA
jgi:glutathione S-transferase